MPPPAWSSFATVSARGIATRPPAITSGIEAGIARSVVGLAGDHDALDAHREEPLDRRGIEPRVEEPVGDHEPVSLVLQALAQAGEQVHEPLVAEVVEHHADRAAARAGEGDGRGGGAVVEPPGWP